MLLEIICILALCLPTVWALWDDRNGDIHPNNDLITITWLEVSLVIAVSAIHQQTVFWLDLIRNILLSTAIYVSLFPYLINILLYKRGVINDSRWFDHLSPTAWPDRLPFWKESAWYVRMFIASWILALGVIVYVCPYKIVSYDNPCFCDVK